MNKNVGILILRLGIGFMFIGHGLPKVLGGLPMWEKVGTAMAVVGISFFPAFWGFMASVAECVGGALLMAGLFTRTAAGFMAFTMLMASLMHLAKGDGFFSGASHAIESMIIFVAIIFAGAGCYSLDYKFCHKEGSEDCC